MGNSWISRRKQKRQNEIYKKPTLLRNEKRKMKKKQYEPTQNRDNVVEEDINLGKLFDLATGHKNMLTVQVYVKLEMKFY